MSLKQRAPYVLGLSCAAAMLALAGWDSWRDRNGLVWWAPYALSAVTLAGLAVMLGFTRPGARWVPEWAHRFELATVPGLPAHGLPPATVLRCNRCDATVLPRAERMTLPRILTYAWTHTSLACEPRRARDPESTRRLSEDTQRRGLRRPRRVPTTERKPS